MKQTPTNEPQKSARTRIALVLIIIAVVWSILRGYAATWTGFGDFTAPDGEFVRGKTLWDWMELLIIPLSLLVGAFLLNQSERSVERQIAENRAQLEHEIATDSQQETALQAYIDRMADLLLKGKLQTSKDEGVRNVARIRTLTVLRRLDAKRKGVVLLFLHESGLIVEQSVISLTGANLAGADLSGAKLMDADLRGADMSGADMSGANLIRADLRGVDLRKARLSITDLSGANLSEARLSGAHLIGVHLSKANLSRARLVGANLSGADLRKADLSEADMSRARLIGACLIEARLSKANLIKADLRGADLNGAKVSDEQLATAQSLEGAIMPDGTKHD